MFTTLKTSFIVEQQYYWVANHLQSFFNMQLWFLAIYVYQGQTFIQSFFSTTVEECEAWHACAWPTQLHCMPSFMWLAFCLNHAHAYWTLVKRLLHHYSNLTALQPIIRKMILCSAKHFTALWPNSFAITTDIYTDIYMCCSTYGSRQSTKPAWDFVYWAKPTPKP